MSSDPPLVCVSTLVNPFFDIVFHWALRLLNFFCMAPCPCRCPLWTSSESFLCWTSFLLSSVFWSPSSVLSFEPHFPAFCSCWCRPFKPHPFHLFLEPFSKLCLLIPFFRIVFWTSLSGFLFLLVHVFSTSPYSPLFFGGGDFSSSEPHLYWTSFPSFHSLPNKPLFKPSHFSNPFLF